MYNLQVEDVHVRRIIKSKPKLFKSIIHFTLKNF